MTRIIYNKRKTKMTIDLSDLQGGGNAKPLRKKTDKPLLNTVSSDKVDQFLQGNTIRKEGEALKKGPEGEIKEAYIEELFSRNAGVAEPAKTFRAGGSAPADAVTVYSHSTWAKVALQDGTEVDPKGEAKVRALKDITKSKFDKCFEEHVEVKLDTSAIPSKLKDEFVMDMIAVLNKYGQAHTLRKVLKFKREFDAGRYEMLTPQQNLKVDQHIPLTVIVK